jgi:GNAT superfamily N-acetyltransferase
VADIEPLYRLHREVMHAYVARTLGVWDEDWQRQQFWEAFHPRTCRVIVYNGQYAGVCAYELRGDEYFLRLLEVLPEFQHKGIGTVILRRLIARARRENRPVTLLSIKDEGARRFYESQGFRLLGETATHYLMQRGE